MKYIFRAFSFLFLTLTLVPYCTFADVVKGSPSNVSVQLSWRYQFQFAPFITAYEKGFYKDVGLDVEIKEGGPGINAVERVVNGEADFGIFSSALAVEYAKGKPVVALAALMQHSPVGIVARHTGEINSVHDLAGKIIATSEDTRDEILAYLKATGISQDQVNIADKTKVGLANLESADAISVYTSNEAFYLKGHEKDYLLFSPRSGGIDLFGNILFTTKQKIEDQRQQAKAFRAATLRGLEYALTHKEEIADLILKHYNTQNKTREHLLFEANVISELTRTDIVEPGYMSSGRWKHVAEVYASQDKMPHDIDLKAFIYDPNPQIDITKYYWAIAGTIIILIIVSIFLWQAQRYNARLQKEIKEHEETEKLLRASEFRFKDLFNRNPDPCWLIDNYTFVECNQAAANIFGFPDKNTLIKSHPSRFSPEKQPDGMLSKVKANAMMDIAQQQGIHRFEWIHQRMNGERFTVEVTLAKYNMQGQNILYCIWHDISERKQAEEERTQLQRQLLHSQKMEMIGQLTGGIAHDFNNILGTMLGHIDLILQEKDNLSSSTMEYLSEIDKAGTRAGELVKKMLAFARGSKEEIEILDPRPMVNEALKMLSSTLPSSIELIKHIDTPVPPIHIASIELQQIIVNLIINARDAMAGEGRIEVRLQHLKNINRTCTACQNSIEGDYVELSVQDSGEGISTDVLTRIFDPFFSTKEVGKGSGMGLAMVMGIIHKVNGHIIVKTQQGEGTTFCLLFPV